MPTLVIHEPSRFDRSNGTPFCSTAGEWFLRELDKHDGGIRTVLSLEAFQALGGFRSPDIASFTHILAVGDKPRIATIGNRIPPGYAVVKLNGARLLATFDPQVAHDFQHEDDDEDDGEDQSNKDITATRHANFRYWIQVHIDKLFNPRPTETNQRSSSNQHSPLSHNGYSSYQTPTCTWTSKPVATSPFTASA